MKYLIILFLTLFLSGCFTNKACINVNRLNNVEQNVKAELDKKIKSEYIAKNYEKNSNKKISQTDVKSLYSFISLINPNYYNGNKFGNLCISVAIKLKKDIFKIKKVEYKNFCYKNPNTEISELEKKAEEAAVKKILKEHYPDLSQISNSNALKLISNYKTSNEHLNLADKEYCFDFSLSYFPADIEIFRFNKNNSEEGQKKLKKEKFDKIGSFTLYMGKLKIGDLPKNIGDYIVVKAGSEGKGLGTFMDETSIIIKRKIPGNFKIKMLIHKEYKHQYGRILDNKYTIIKLFYDGFVHDYINMYFKYKNGLLKMYFKKDDAISQTFSPDISLNFDEIIIVKYGNSLKYFLNGDYKFTFNTNGKILNKIEIPIGKSDILYSLEVINLDKKETPYKLTIK